MNRSVNIGKLGKKQLNWGKVFTLAGAFIAFLIGSGFATGQEVMQYFSSFGLLGAFGVIVVFLLFLYVGIEFMIAGYNNKFAKGSDIFYYYCGKRIGKFYDYFSVAFIYMSYIVMIGGSAATLNQQYGQPTWVGGVMMGILAGGTVIFGLGKIVDVIGKIGPTIVVLTVILGIFAIAMNPSGFANANEIIPQLDLLKASSNWFFSAVSYVGFCMLWLAGFMSQLGASSDNKNESILGTIIGAAGFSLALLIITLGIMANIEELSGSMVPNLVLANKVHPVLGTIFSLIVVAGIYTTAVPLLWQAVARFSEDKTPKFRILTVVFAAAGVFVGLLVPFDKLVNIIYVINGYVGILLFVFMAYKTIRVRVLKKVEE